MPIFNFRLEVFHTVATTLNFTKAAEILHITQPAVTKNIKELESSLRIPLFERGKGTIRLTKGGELLLEYTTRMIGEEKQLEYRIGLLRGAFSGELRLGASTTVGQYVLPPVLARFNRKYPDIGISLLNNNTLEIEREVADRELDLGVVEGNAKRKELKYIPFMKDEIVAIAHTSQPLSRKGCVTLQELGSLPLVLREPGSGSLEVITSALAAAGLRAKELNIRIHLGSTESIKTFLANADCIGFVSIHAVSREIVKGDFRIIDVEGVEITRLFHFIYPQGEQNGLAGKFIGFALENGSRENPR